MKGYAGRYRTEGMIVMFFFCSMTSLAQALQHPPAENQIDVTECTGVPTKVDAGGIADLPGVFISVKAKTNSANCAKGSGSETVEATVTVKVFYHKKDPKDPDKHIKIGEAAPFDLPREKWMDNGKGVFLLETSKPVALQNLVPKPDLTVTDHLRIEVSVSSGIAGCRSAADAKSEQDNIPIKK